MRRRRFISANATAGSDYSTAAAGHILCSDLSTIPAANFSGSGKTAIGVVYHNGSNLLRVVSLLSTGYPGAYYYRGYGAYGDNIAAITDATTEQAAISDLSGKANTQAIVAYYGGYNAIGTAVAAGFCVHYSTAGTSAQDWYKPSAGEAYLIHQANAAVQAARQVLSLPQFYYMQTSSEYDAEYGWYVGIHDGSLYRDATKNDALPTIPVLSITY